jgi:type I restriction-modification system DNA methylase subunit
MSQHDQLKSSIQKFLQWFEKCEGDEKQESQLFFEKLLQAFGNAGVKEVGAHCEYRLSKKEGKGKKFADFVWEPRTVIELKSRGEPLHKHFNQVLEYWNTICPKLKYMILCNFDEFWIYDPNVQMYDPIHILKTKDLAKEWPALSFLLPKEEPPVFNNNNVAVTEEAAKVVGELYLSLLKRKVDSEKAQRFALQLVVSLFAEDVELIPKNTLFKILHEAIKKPVAQAELYELFSAMAEEKENKKPKKYKDIPYFNGGIFNKIEPIEFNFEEISILADASEFDWSKVRPSIFGSIFESSIDENKRHVGGVHFTSEADIQKIVTPTIVRPFKIRIEKALSAKKPTIKELSAILKDIREFRVLDPACGSGNFLYIAFRELRRLEAEVLEALDSFKSEKGKRGGMIGETSGVHARNFYGIDRNMFALELAKISLSIGRKLSSDELGINDNILPFDNLDDNFQNKDALLEAKWPAVEAIIGNPPFQSKNKMLQEFGQEYVNELRERYPKVSGYADYCVYWFRKSHEHLKDECRAGLVGTNTIRQNQSRESGLDYIVQNGGTISEAVSSQVWSGDAVVHVSIVNWIKGKDEEEKTLFFQNGDNLQSPWSVYQLNEINSALSLVVDVSNAKLITENKKSNSCFPGQQHGHDGFLLDKKDAIKMLKVKGNDEVLFPFLIGRELVGSVESLPERYVIDFGERDIISSGKYKELFKIISETVLPWRKEKAEEETKRNKVILKKNPKAKVDRQYESAYNVWWQLRRKNTRMVNSINKLSRYIACSRVTKRAIFEFVSPSIRPNDSIQVFGFQDNYSFGIIQSEMHWAWFTARCSTLKGDYRYTSDTVFDTFPWPQDPTEKQVKAIAEFSQELRDLRSSMKKKNNFSLRDLYKSLESPGKNPLRDAHEKLDKAVRDAYGMSKDEDALKFLLDLNLNLSNKESLGERIVGPGLPPCVKDAKQYVTKDCIDINY